MGIADLLADMRNVVVTLVAILGSLFAVRQVREARKARLLGPYFEMDRRLHDQRDDRGFLYRTPHDGSAAWKQIFERVAVTFDVLGALVREDMIYTPIVFKIYYDAIIKTWDRVQNHVFAERVTRKNESTHGYLNDFEYLYQRAKEYIKIEGIPYPRLQEIIDSSGTAPTRPVDAGTIGSTAARPSGG
jgi:hypothetical protein